jgi:hypothetical protein
MAKATDMGNFTKYLQIIEINYTKWEDGPKLVEDEI